MIGTSKKKFSECTQDEIIINFRQKKPNYTPIVVKGVDQMDKYSYYGLVIDY